MHLGEGGRVKPDELTAGDILLSLKEDTRVSAADERGRGLERTLASCKEKDCRLRHTAPSSGQRGDHSLVRGTLPPCECAVFLKRIESHRRAGTGWQ